MNDKTEQVLKELQELWEDEYEGSYMVASNHRGIRSTQIMALVDLLVRKGVVD